MTETNFVPKRILVPTDLSDHAARAVRYGAALAARSGAELHILHVLTLHGYDPMLAQSVLTGLQNAIADLEQELEAHLEREAAAQVPGGVSVRTALRRSMSPYDAILAYASEENVDWIVMSTSGKTGLNYVMLGSVTEKVVEYADRPVLVVRAGGRDFVDVEGQVHLSRILFPTDFSEASEAAGPVVGYLARSYGADVVCAHVLKGGREVEILPKPREEDGPVAEAFGRLQGCSERLFGKDLSVRFRVGRGPVPHTLAEIAREDAVDIVVMASQGEDSLLDRLVGSVAGRMLRLSPCPVFVVKRGKQ